MPQLFLPQSARNEIEQDRSELREQWTVFQELEHWTAELRRLIDPSLRVVKAHDQVAPGSPFKAGYYHVVVDAPGHPSTVMPVEYPDGSFRELGSHIYDLIEENDMWNDRARKAGRERNRKLKEAAERQRERDRQERIERYDERWASANRTSILVSRDIR